jgi:ParB family chromosome partitioning protein
MDKKPALGKGLSALIPDAVDPLAPAPGPLEVDIDSIEPSPDQPRKHQDEARLEELARSISANGVIQPIVVRRIEGALGSGRYQIIAGERRWRAARRAGLERVPIVVKEIAAVDRRRQLELALIENIQRENLNPIEEANAYQRLAGEFGLRQEDIAQQVGKDRATVANYLRLLKLPDEVRANIASGALSMGHARAIVSLTAEADQLRLARDVVARGLSVRETESLVKRESGAGDHGPARPAPVKDVHTRAAEEQLRMSLGTRVEIRRKRVGGVLEIAFASEDELQRLYEYITER